MGLTEQGFWRLTLREFDALMQRHNDVQERTDARVALLCTVVVNMLRDPKKPAVKLSAFMPQKQRPPQTPEEMVLIAKLLTLAHGGTIEVKDGPR